MIHSDHNDRVEAHNERVKSYSSKKEQVQSVHKDS